MVAFFILVMISIVATSVWITRRLLAEPGTERPEQRHTVVPLDDAPPGVLDAIVRQLRQGPNTA